MDEEEPELVFPVDVEFEILALVEELAEVVDEMPVVSPEADPEVPVAPPIVPLAEVPVPTVAPRLDPEAELEWVSPLVPLDDEVPEVAPLLDDELAPAPE